MCQEKEERRERRRGGRRRRRHVWRTCCVEVMWRRKWREEAEESWPMTDWGPSIELRLQWEGDHYYSDSVYCVEREKAVVGHGDLVYLLPWAIRGSVWYRPVFPLPCVLLPVTCASPMWGERRRCLSIIEPQASVLYCGLCWWPVLLCVEEVEGEKRQERRPVCCVYY